MSQAEAPIIPLLEVGELDGALFTVQVPDHDPQPLHDSPVSHYYDNAPIYWTVGRMVLASSY